MAEPSMAAVPGEDGVRYLWHGIDKYESEIKLARKVQVARRKLIDYLINNKEQQEMDAKKCINSNDYGDVVLKVSIITPGALPIKVYDADRATGLLRVVQTAPAKLAAAGFDFAPGDHLAEINA